MKQFFKILKFELNNFFTNKIFVGITIFLLAAIILVMNFPRILEAVKGEDAPEQNEEKPIMVVSGNREELSELITELFSSAFTEYQVDYCNESVDTIKQQIQSGQISCAFYLDSLTSYTYYVDNLSMYDGNTLIADTALKNVYQASSMINGGMTQQQVNDVLTVQIEHKIENLGKDQMQNFFYTYIMIFSLYMVILLYGQLVASNVASEKSSRAMELLITSAKPTSMMFGKVFASCAAGLLQIVLIFGSAIVSFNFNKEYWSDNQIIISIFDMPTELFIYMIIFFILGFLMYSFMYGAIGSTASKLEDINTSVMPVTMLFIVSFMIVMFSMTSGDTDSLLMKVSSFIPFVSPMAMFTRIAMSSVPIYEIIISILILVVSVFGVGFISAKIYRVGVLLYGMQPKVSTIIKAMKNK